MVFFSEYQWYDLFLLIYTLFTYFDILRMARDNLLFTVVAVYSKS